jgi:hypothetical protein
VGVKNSLGGSKNFTLLKMEPLHTLSHRQWKVNTLSDLHIYPFSTGKGVGYYEYLY